MNTWNQVVPGYQTKVVQVGSITINIHRPELEPGARAKREKDVMRTLAGTGRKLTNNKPAGKPA